MVASYDQRSNTILAQLEEVIGKVSMDTSEFLEEGREALESGLLDGVCLVDGILDPFERSIK